MTKENLQQISELKEMIENHCTDQVVTDQVVSDKLDQLMPLVSLIPVLQELAKERDINIAMEQKAAKIGRTIIFIGSVIGAMFLFVQLIFKLEK